MEKISKLEKLWKPKIVWDTSEQTMMVEDDSNDQNYDISIKWQSKKKTKNPKI